MGEALRTGGEPVRKGSPPTRRRPASLTGALAALTWLCLGLGVGWMVGVLADHVQVPADHVRALVGLAGCGAVLVGWAYGSRLIYLDILAGLREAASDGTEWSVGRRSRHAWVVAIAAPVIGLVLALSSPHHTPRGAGAPGGPQRAGVVRTVGRAGSPHADPVASTEGSRPPTPPTPPALPAAATPSPAAATYTIRPGDRLSDLAERFYGSSADWPRIARANAGRLHEPSGARLVDPSVLPAGLQLEIPGPILVSTQGAEGAEGIGGNLAPAGGEAGAASTARDDALFAAVAGFGLLGGALLAARQRRRRRLQSMRLGVGALRPRLCDHDALLEAQLRPLLAVELPVWIDATNRLLFERLRGRQIPVPTIGAMRAGAEGIELLLERPALAVPDGFQAFADGTIWRLDPGLTLDDLVAALPADTRPLLPVLVPIAEDAAASYLVACAAGESLGLLGAREQVRIALGAIATYLGDTPWSEVACYRLGPAGFVGAAEMQEIDLPALEGLAPGTGHDPLWRDGLPESQPVVLVEDPGLAESAREVAPPIVSLIGPLEWADRRVLLGHGRARLEPLGVDLPERLPRARDLDAARRLRAATQALPGAPGIPTASTVPREGAVVRPGPGPAPSTDRPDVADGPDDVVPPGSAEVRVLRPLPDLVGALSGRPPGRDAVALIAYLALHGGEARPGELREALAAYRSDDSKRQRALWNAASNARAALGPARLPVIRGDEPYRLAGAVTCDWLRFRDMTSLARACERGGAPTRALSLLKTALALVGDGEPCSDDSVVVRYLWLDAEQLRDEIETAIVAAAHDLAMLCLARSSEPDALETAAWAIATGRRARPDAKPLREAALFLADARGDVAELDAELASAIDAVDALGLGADLDPETEAIYTSLRRARPPASTHAPA